MSVTWDAPPREALRLGGERRRRTRAALPAGSLQLWRQVSDSASGTSWVGRYQLLVLATDAIAVSTAACVALWIRFGWQSATLNAGDGWHVPYSAVATALSSLWLISLGLARCYEDRYVDAGTEEIRRLVNASAAFIALVAVIGYATGIEIARGYVGWTMPIGLVLLVLGRLTARRLVRRRRLRGGYCHRVLAVGSRRGIADLVAQTHRSPQAGYVVIAGYVPGSCDEADMTFGKVRVPVYGGGADGVRLFAEACSADTVVVTPSGEMDCLDVRSISWSLEGTGTDLIMAPALTDVAGPRIAMRPVAGLPLLHVEEPEFSGVRRVAKSLFERGLALALLTLLVPAMLALAVAIKLDSTGPVFFRQVRVGKGGREFRLFKFRSMAVDAEQRLTELMQLNQADSAGLLFKMRDDPRVTRVGRWIRRYSLDELPQLINVLLGDMAIVGPRPPLPKEVAAYQSDVSRRLLVAPGITGLWQVSGRSDLSWHDGIQLDLYYVENWSPLLDLQIIAKTFLAVTRAAGAY